MVNFKKLLVSRQKKNNEQRKKKVFRLDLRDLIHFQVQQKWIPSGEIFI